MMPLQSPFVFLSYATPDRARVREVRQFLQANGIHAWLDEEDIRGGERWELEIERALDAAELVVVLISPASMDRDGFYHRELRMVLERAQRRPSGRVFPIPVLLDPHMNPPELIRDLHCIRLTGQEGWDRLLRDVRGALGQQEQARDAIRQDAEIDWSFPSQEEKWDGLPGYDAEISWPEYTSTRFPLLSQVGDAIRAEMQMMLASERGVRFYQEPDIYSHGQEKWERTNTLSVSFEDPIIRHRVLTQFARVYMYGAGTLHGNHAPQSWVFVLDPLVPIHRLEMVFSHAESVFARLQEEVRTLVLAELEAHDPGESEEVREARRSWIEEGTKDWEAFRCFGFEPGGLRLRFAPYVVAPYAVGTVSVLVPYAVVKEHFHRPYVDVLGLRWGDDSEVVPWQPTSEESSAW